MTTRYVCDESLVIAADMGPFGPQVCRELALAQCIVFEHWGHCLDTRSEYVRRKIKLAATQGTIAGFFIACITCGCTAPLSVWSAVASRSAGDRAAMLLAFPHETWELVELMTTQCHAYGMGAATLLLLEEKEANNARHRRQP